MARLPRLDLPGIPQHIVQRGNNRLPCLFDDGDRLRYLQALREALMANGVQLHAYVLMDNHVHLLATPIAAGDIEVTQATARTPVRRPVQCPPPSHRHTLGRPLQGMPCR